MATAALAFGIIGGALGIIFGFIALHQIKRTGDGGRGRAIAGIVLSSMWLLGAAALFALGAVADSLADDLDSSPGASPTEPKEVDAKKMKVGDCINDDQGATNTTATGEPVEVESVKIVPCNGPHDGEVMAVFRLTGAVMPSDQQMSQLASAGCKKRMLSRISRDPAANALATSYYYPTAESWRAGDRAVTCVAVAATEGQKLTRKLHS